MELDAEQFLEQHDLSEAGIDILAYADPDPQVCIISFSSMNPGKFERYKWFQSRRLDTPSLYIFLKDEAQHYYRGTPDNPLKSQRMAVLSALFAKHGISRERTITVGSSMGGYAAVDYAVSMGLGGSITVNPQVDRESALLHTLDHWHRKMDEADWEDLDQMILNSPKAPTSFLIIRGRYPADTSACSKLLQALQQRAYPYSLEIVANEEHGWMGMNSRRLLTTLNDFASEGRFIDENQN